MVIVSWSGGLRRHGIREPAGAVVVSIAVVFAFLELG